MLRPAFFTSAFLFLFLTLPVFAAQQPHKSDAAPAKTQPQKQGKDAAGEQKPAPSAQTEKGKPNPANPDLEKKPKKNLDPDAIELSGREFITKDNVLLSGVFYPGNADKETVPVILFHEQGKSHEEFAPLIAAMKKQGYAILAFDFRGHGDSTQRFVLPKKQANQTQTGMMPGMGMPQRKPKKLPPGMGGGVPGLSDRDENVMMPINPAMLQPQQPQQLPQLTEYLEADFGPEDYKNMYKFDCLPFYHFLTMENNEEKLNLNKLVIVGLGMGGSVGGKLSKELWASAKRKNIRSLIVVSPNYDPFSKQIFKNTKCFHEDVPLLFMVGALDNRAKENALTLREDILGKEKRKDDDPTLLTSPVPVAEFPTERQGGDLLADSKQEIPTKIVNYIEETLAKHKEKDLKWKKM